MNDHDPKPAFSLSHPGDLIDFFRQELQLAIARLGLTSTHETMTYLIHLLERYIKLENPSEHKELGFERPAAFMLGDAVEALPAERIEAYRKLGDACLYNCGFFDARITRRAVSASYYKRMGRDAYHSVADMMRGGDAGRALRQIFAELAEKFEGFVAAFRQLATPQSPQELLLERLQRGENVTTEELVRAGVLVGVKSPIMS